MSEISDDHRKNVLETIVLLSNEFHPILHRWFLRELTELEHFHPQLSNRQDDCLLVTIGNPRVMEFYMVSSPLIENSTTNKPIHYSHSKLSTYLGIVHINTIRTLFSKVLILKWPSEVRDEIDGWMKNELTWNRMDLVHNVVPMEMHVSSVRWWHPKRWMLRDYSDGKKVWLDNVHLERNECNSHSDEQIYEY